MERELIDAATHTHSLSLLCKSRPRRRWIRDPCGWGPRVCREASAITSGPAVTLGAWSLLLGR